MICRRCGFGNQGGDQFCGSCGAFLEWEGEATETAPPVVRAPGSTAGEAGEAVVPATRPADEWAPDAATAVVPPVTRGPVDAPTSRVSAPVPVTSDALLRCPGCGIANAATRTFCQSCGTRLVETARITEPSREQIAAAVAATPKARPGAVTAGTATRPDPAATGRSGGIARWILAMVVFGGLFGVGIVVAGVVLRSPGPSTGAEATPGGAGASGSAEPGASDPGASPDPTEDPAGVPLAATGARASSVVGNRAKFQPEMVIDGNRRTCWQEGKKTEKGQWVEVTFEPSTVRAVDIINGYADTTALFRGNHRPKVVRITVDDGEPVEVTLQDAPAVQRVELEAAEGATRLRVTIVSVYPAKKSSVEGTPFDDAAISEITVIGAPGG